MFSDPVILRWATLIVFIVSFALFLSFERYRHWLALAAAVLTVILGILGPIGAIVAVDWRIIIIFFTTLVAAEVFMISGAAAVTAESIVARLKRPAYAILALCASTGLLSMFVENVACVLIVAPIALSLARRLDMPPQPILVACALASNLQGCALLVGDPPSMILASEAKFTFFEFIWYDGQPSIFWAVQVGALAGLGYLWFVFRKYKGIVEVDRTAYLMGIGPTIFLAGVVLSIAVDTQVEGGIGWGAAAGTTVFAILAFIWYLRQLPRIPSENKVVDEASIDHMIPTVPAFLRGLDWRTTLFLIAIFVPVTALAEWGWVQDLGALIGDISGGSRLTAFVILVVAAMLASAIIDNVPFLLVMLPTVTALAGDIGITWKPVFLYFGLLIGASVGGNITPIGAQANIAAMGFLRKHGRPMSVKSYMSISIPFTVAAVATSCAFLFFVYGDPPESQTPAVEAPAVTAPAEPVAAEPAVLEPAAPAPPEAP